MRPEKRDHTPISPHAAFVSIVSGPAPITPLAGSGRAPGQPERLPSMTAGGTRRPIHSLLFSRTAKPIRDPSTEILHCRGGSDVPGWVPDSPGSRPGLPGKHAVGVSWGRMQINHPILFSRASVARPGTHPPILSAAEAVGLLGGWVPDMGCAHSGKTGGGDETRQPPLSPPLPPACILPSLAPQAGALSRGVRQVCGAGAAPRAAG
jgi:hypothetical protein